LKAYLQLMRDGKCPPVYSIDCVASKAFCERKICWANTIAELFGWDKEESSVVQ